MTVWTNSSQRVKSPPAVDKYPEGSEYAHGEPGEVTSVGK